MKLKFIHNGHPCILVKPEKPSEKMCIRDSPEGALKTFEWCARANMAYPERGVPFQQETGENYLALCDSNGIFYSRDTSLLPEPFSSVFQKVEARSVLHIPMMDGTHIKGLIGFSETHSCLLYTSVYIVQPVAIFRRQYTTKGEIDEKHKGISVTEKHFSKAATHDYGCDIVYLSYFLSLIHI